MKFFIKFFITLLLLFVLWIIIIFLQSSNPTKTSQWVYDAYKKKSNIANSIKDKKIVIVAGSNALFGIDSKKLSDSFNVPVVNFGVNAGVLLPYTLYKSKEVIKSGDIVLMPLEYPMYNYDGIPNEQMIDYIFSRDIDMFFSLTLREQFYMVWNITFRRLYNGYMSLGGNEIKSGLYGSHNIDEHGDQINTSIKYRNNAMQKELKNLKANSYGKEFNQNTISWSYLDEFVDWCSKKSIKVIFMPSTLMYFDSYKNIKEERWFYENIDNVIKEKGWKYIGEPYEYMYSRELYFNTDFHLIESAKERRTNQMIFDLKFIIKKI